MFRKLDATMTFDEFEQHFFHATSWAERKDGPPLEDLDALSPTDLGRAETELINHLSLEDDWPILGLAHLRSAKAVPRLRELLPTAKGAIRAKIALAIWKACNDPKMLEIVLNLSRASHLSDTPAVEVFERIDVIHCLAQFTDPAAKARLEALTTDAEYLVAYNAEYALKLREEYYGIRP